MRVRPGDEIAGYPAGDIKKLLRGVYSRRITSAEIGRRLELLEPDLSETLRVLADQHFLVWDGNHLGMPVWKVGPRGQRLLANGILHPVSRQRADALLAGVIARCREVNRAIDYAYSVSRLAVFGSYLDDVDELGDLDLAVDLARRTDPPGRDRFEEAEQRCPHPDRLTRTAWPQKEIRKKLKGAQPSVSIHGFDEIEDIGARHLLVYQYDPVRCRELTPETTPRTPDSAEEARSPATAGLPRACTSPQDPPYIPEAAPRRPRRISRSDEISLDELAAQAAWANGLSAREILEEHRIAGHSPRSLEDLIAALYRHAHDGPDVLEMPRGSLAGCYRVRPGCSFDPHLQALRDDAGITILTQVDPRTSTHPQGPQGWAAGPDTPVLDQAIVRALGPDARTTCAQLTAVLGAEVTGEQRGINLTVYADDGLSPLVEVSVPQDPERDANIATANDHWLEAGRRLRRVLAEWSRGVEAALDRCQANIGTWINCDDIRPAQACARPDTAATTTEPITNAITEALARYPNLARRAAEDHRMICTIGSRNIARELRASLHVYEGFNSLRGVAHRHATRRVDAVAKPLLHNPPAPLQSLDELQITFDLSALATEEMARRTAA